MQPKILIFTYYWPPSGGPAVQRWLSFSNLLCNTKYQPVVITVDEKVASYTLTDNSLSSKTNSGIEVHKTHSFEILNLYKRWLGKGNLPTAGFANESNPSVFQKLIRWFRGNLFFPDPRKGWNKYAINKASEIINSENVIAVITAGPPHSTHLIGMHLKHKYSLHWIADFHDAWTNVWYYDKLNRTSWAKKIDKKLERKVLLNADNVITVGSGLAAYLQGIKGNKVLQVSMGYDEDVFNEPWLINTNSFTITYTGTMADNYEPEVFFKAIKACIDNGLKIQINLVGLISDGILKKIDEMGLKHLVSSPGYKTHTEVIQYLKDACMLLLVSPNTSQSERIIPGKIYEYMACEIPIINLGESHYDSSKILLDNNAGKTFNRAQVKEISEYIIGIYNKWIDDSESIRNTKSTYKQFGRGIELQKIIGLIPQPK